MSAAPKLPDWLKAVLTLVGHGVFFDQTIRRNCSNRPLVLGVCTVVMFVVFLIVVSLSGQGRLQAVVTVATIGLGIAVLVFFVGQDVVRWASHQGPPEGRAVVKSSEA